MSRLFRRAPGANRCPCGASGCTNRREHTSVVRVRSQAEGRPPLSRARLGGGL